MTAVARTGGWRAVDATLRRLGWTRVAVGPRIDDYAHPRRPRQCVRVVRKTTRVYHHGGVDRSDPGAWSHHQFGRRYRVTSGEGAKAMLAALMRRR